MGSPVLPMLCLGWHAVDPGPPPVSPLLDAPPVADPRDIVAEHRRWRDAVERDERRLSAIHAQAPVWHPVVTSGREPVVPVFGGTPATLDHLVANLVIGADETGFERVRIVNLLRWDVLATLRRLAARARRLSVRFDVVTSRGSSLDLFATTTPDEVAGLVVDALRTAPDGTGRRDASRDKQELLKVASMLDQPVTLERLRDALDVALTGGAVTPIASAFSPKERRDLRDFHASVVRQRTSTADRLSDLHADLRELASYARSPSLRPERLGTGPQRVRVVEVGGGALHEVEVAREVLARAAARAFDDATAPVVAEMLVVVGAETLAAEVLDSLVAAAHRLGRQLVLLFTEIAGQAERALGRAGAGVAVFLRLPSYGAATVASDHLGREFTFVVNGVSIAEGETTEWSEAYGTSTSRSRGRSYETGGSAGFTGAALSFGRSFGSSVSSTLTTGSSQTSTAGATASRTVTVSHGRVHEHVVEPEVFQQLEEDVMVVVVGRTVVLASCDYRIRRLPITSPQPLAIP